MGFADTVQAGIPEIFTAVFYDEVIEQAGDPGTVAFSWETPLTDDATTYTYGEGDEITREVVNDLPMYSVTVPTLGLPPAGDKTVLTGQWDTEGGITFSGSLDVLVLAPDIESPFDT